MHLETLCEMEEEPAVVLALSLRASTMTENSVLTAGGGSTQIHLIVM